jgi:molybdopterin converting factor small subunit
MDVILNVIGPEIRHKLKARLDITPATLRRVLRALRDQGGAPWGRIIKDDLSLAEGWLVLVNGRNIMSLEGFETEIRDGDEVTFSVLVAGG